jgi:hypothetical protein
MAFTSIATDDFNRANGNIGSNWTHIRELSWDATPPQILSNVVVGKSGGVAHYQVVRWAGAGTFSDDQYAEATVGGMAFNGDAFLTGVVVRCSADTDTAADFYGVYILDDAPSGSNHTTVVFKMVNGTSTTIATLTTTPWTNGDEVLLSAIGTTLRLYKNRSLIGTYTGQTDLTTGKPGLLLGGNATAVMNLDNAELGDATVDVASAAPAFFLFSC